MITVYNKFLEQVNLGAIDLETDTIKCVLVDATYTIDRDHDFRNDVTGQIAGTTATVTGITVTVDNAIDKSLVDHNDIVYTAITCNPRYLLVYKDTGSAATDLLIYVLNFETTYTLTSDNLTITPPVGGLLSYQQTETETNTDVLVKISSNDTTAGYLNGKLVAGDNIEFNENNDGSNETLTIATAANVAFTSININGTNGNGHVHLKHQASDPSSTGSSTTIFADSNGNLALKNDGISKATFDTDGITAARVWAFPDASGTVALTSNLSDFFNKTTDDTDDITDTATSRFTNDTDITRLANTSGTNTGDQDLSGLVPNTRTVNGHTLSSNVTITKSDVGLGNVDNTSDVNKPVSTATQTALDDKEDIGVASGIMSTHESSYDHSLIANAIQVGGSISDLINDANYLNPYPKVISRLADEPVSPTLGDRHIVLSPATGAEWPAHENEIAEWNGTIWTYSSSNGAFVYVSSESKIYYFDVNDGWLEFTDDLGSSGGGGAWGSITGTITDQTDLVTYLSDFAKLDGSNQYFTGDIGVEKSSPRISVIETTDDATGYIEKLSTDNELRHVSQNRLFLSGNGLTLNGSGNANRAAVSMGTNWSIDFWYKTSSTASQIIASGNTSADIHFWFSAANTVTVRGFSYTFAVFTTTYADNLWHHWVVTSNSGGTITVYKDNVSLGSQTVGTTAHVLTNIGNYGVDSGHKCVGTIDQLVVWNKVLNGSEVSTRYNGGAGAEISDYTNVIAEYRFNSTYTDSSPNGYNMSAQGSGNTFSVGRVPSGVEPLTDLEYLSVCNDSINLSLGTIKLGTYSGSYASTNIYEGLSHRFNILGVSKFEFDGTNATLVGNTSITGTLAVSGDVTTPLRFYAGTGSAAIPSFSFSSDSNTGMYRGSADQINFVTGGVTRVELSNSTTRFQGGSVAVPGIGFTGDTDAGLYTNGAGVGISSGNYSAAFFATTTTTFNNTTSNLFNINAVRAFELTTTAAVFNETGADRDFRIEGDADANLFVADAGLDMIGIGSLTPAYKLDVTGEINATAGYRINGTAGATGTFTTTDLKTVTVTNGIITSIV